VGARWPIVDVGVASTFDVRVERLEDFERRLDPLVANRDSSKFTADLSKKCDVLSPVFRLIKKKRRAKGNGSATRARAGAPAAPQSRARSGRERETTRTPVS